MSPIGPPDVTVGWVFSGLTSDAVVAGRVVMPRVLIDKLRTFRGRLALNSLPSEPGGGDTSACSVLAGEVTMVSCVILLNECMGSEDIGDSGEELGEEPVSAESRVDIVDVGEDPADAERCSADPRRDPDGPKDRVDCGICVFVTFASCAAKSYVAVGTTRRAVNSESVCGLSISPGSGIFRTDSNVSIGRQVEMTERLRNAETVGTFRRTEIRDRS